MRSLTNISGGVGTTPALQTCRAAGSSHAGELPQLGALTGLEGQETNLQTRYYNVSGSPYERWDNYLPAS